MRNLFISGLSSCLICFLPGCSKLKPEPILNGDTVEVVWTVKEANGKTFEFISHGAKYTAQCGQRISHGESTPRMMWQVCAQMEPHLETAVSLHKGDTSCDMHLLIKQGGKKWDFNLKHGDTHPSCQAMATAMNNSFAGWEEAQLIADEEKK
ncbi:MAG: hypothetical protein U0931_23865 [Vulcanimicrobiota bacterium]